MLLKNLTTNHCFEDEVEISEKDYDYKVSELKAKIKLAMNVRSGLISIKDVPNEYQEDVTSILEAWSEQEIQAFNDSL